MRSRDEVEQIIGRTLQPQPNVLTAYLYGSVARGEARPESDVDLAVLLAADPPRTFDGLLLTLEGDLERALDVPVQLLVLNAAPPDPDLVATKLALIVPAELTATLRAMAGFRNIPVHSYQDVDPRIVRDVVERRLDDLLAFARLLRARLPGPGSA